MRGRKDSKPLTTVDGSTTLIAKDATFTGEISFSGNLDIEGKVIGGVVALPDTPAMVRVVAGGCVEGEVRAPAVIINGKVVGDIYCTERLELAEHAEIDGDVYYNLIEMAVGCRLNGGLRHVSAATDDLAAARQARHAELGEAQ
ncbi:polymer-forming cytoskeletal protein [Flavobacteriaceae bacterium]|nr:polymer-forming cytoskeletal protein [Flavobacteriaceae bacterium]|tara:strand:+ start:304 stop:735 length:432 start_codon:yes stop_codon:yes gene_type:complete